MITISLCGLWNTFYRCRCGKVVLLALIIISSGLSVQAHHESLAAPEREYLKLVSLHPFKDKVAYNSGYDFYVTVAEASPQAVDLVFYVENPLFKRPIHAAKEIFLYPEGSSSPQRFVLDADFSGVSSLRYQYHEPFKAKLKILTLSSDNQNISAEMTIQIGSPALSYGFLIMIGLIIISALGYAFLIRRP